MAYYMVYDGILPQLSGLLGPSGAASLKELGKITMTAGTGMTSLEFTAHLGETRPGSSDAAAAM